jgi:glycosyltransferase involved in cell wall biosynthesis
MEKKNINLYVNTMHGGGTERITYMLANYYSNSGHNVTLILNERVGNYLKYVSEQVNIVELNPLINKLFWIKVLFIKLDIMIIFNVLSLRNAINTFKLKDLLCMGEWPNTVGLSYKLIFDRLFRILISERNSKTFITSPETYRLKIISKYFTKKSIRYANHVIACSQDVKKELEPYFDEYKLSVINNPVDVDYIQKLATAEVSHPYFISSNIILIAVGRLSPQKDYLTLLKAFKITKKTIVNIKLLILGKGEEQNTIHKYIIENELENDIELLGFVDNPYKFIFNSDLFVHTALFEGFPNVIAEALACGLNVVSTNCDGVDEILQGGKFGTIVPKQNPKVLAAAIIDALLDKRSEELQKNGIADYSIESIGNKYLNLINGFNTNDLYYSLNTKRKTMGSIQSGGE